MDFPLFVKLAGRHCVVVGSGPVGRRKAHALLHAGASVRVVSPMEPWNDVAGPVAWVRAEYQTAHLDGAELVFAAATSEVNERVIADARAAGLWVNSATDPEKGDFVLPALVQHGPIQVAVSTSGASPILARRIAGMISEQLDEAWITWVELLGELRPEIRSGLPTSERRNDLLAELCDPRWLGMIESEGADTTREQMRELVRQAVEGGD